MNICLFGTFDDVILSNRVTLSGLEDFDNGVSIYRVKEGIPKGILYESNHLTLAQVGKRLYHRIRTFIILLSRFSEVLPASALIVLPFGWSDLFLAAIYKYIFKKIVAYIPQNSLYDMICYAGDHSWLHRLMKRFIFHMERWLWQIPDVIFFNSEEEIKYHKDLLQLPHLHCSVIPLGADDRLFQPLPKVIHREFEVLFYGEYNLGHGADVIVQAAKRLNKVPNIHFRMIGEGKEKPKVLAYAKRHNLTNVTFEGWVTPDVLKQRIASADVTLGMFSGNNLSQRAVPNKIFQALAMKKCVISGSSPAVERWFHHLKQIYIVPCKDPKSLAQAVDYLSKNPETCRRIALNGYHSFKRDFWRQPIGEKIINEIKELHSFQPARQKVWRFL